MSLLNTTASICHPSDDVQKTQKSRVFLSTNVRDEKNLLEWVFYHLEVGFDHILVVDHLSVVPVAEVLKNVEKVTVMTCSLSEAPKMHIMNKICLPFMQESKADWFIHLDADEYWNPCKPNFRVQEFLANFSSASHVSVNWVLFGNSFFRRQPKGCVISNFTACAGVQDAHVKVFMRPKDIVCILNPHHAEIRPGAGRRTDCFGETVQSSPFVHLDLQKKGISCISELPCVINHYYCQSFQTYMNRKFRRSRDDCNLFRDFLSFKALNSGKSDWSHMPWNQNVNCNRVVWDFLKKEYGQKIEQKTEKWLSEAHIR